MRLIRFVVLAISVSALAVMALPQANATNMVGCPQLCLTGGLVKQVSAGSVLTTGRASVASESHEYMFDWAALDLTTLPPSIQDIGIEVDATGTTTDGVFRGTGHVYLRPFGYGPSHASSPVEVIDDGHSVQVDTDHFQNEGTVFHMVMNKDLGLGEASVKTAHQPFWGVCDCG
jgi:hypothetical protein